MPSFRNLPDKLSMPAALGPCSLRRSTKLLFQGSSWSEWYIFSVFFCLFTFPQKCPKIKNLSTQYLKLDVKIFKVIKSCARKMVKRTHLLLNYKTVKSFLRRSNSSFGLNQLTAMVDMPCRIIIGKFQPLKQGFGFIVHTRIFKIATFQEWK